MYPPSAITGLMLSPLTLTITSPRFSRGRLI